ncbi:hypothetical protein CROQUDRAFT_105355 [Cronartium quercuum f. sp. fusiforme G11]|uniref:Glucose-methanol-choline oxidoreductase N-terminal domain-containing protein n=1 Tax=Cronartium quercuum f. sp. fusiforme G11 TaxID=708437 RepID=A0A9P6NT35_9BASI|nr:hypothetical protein CROQUDRAFT_105355 [Cronartium quercuum f. sp. fusiforme G11]
MTLLKSWETQDGMRLDHIENCGEFHGELKTCTHRGSSEINRASKKSKKSISSSLPINFTFFFFFPLKITVVMEKFKISFPKYPPATFSNYFPVIRDLVHQPALTGSYGGKMDGPYNFPSMINENAERVTSATAYYLEGNLYHSRRYNKFFSISSSREILKVRLDCEVDRLLTTKYKEGEVIIKRVQYPTRGSTKEALARREVILSAGAIGTSSFFHAHPSIELRHSLLSSDVEMRKHHSSATGNSRSKKVFRPRHIGPEQFRSQAEVPRAFM